MTKAGWLGSGSLILCALFLANGALGAAAVKPPATQQRVQLADLFGESDEEKAARAQKEQNQDEAINGLNAKVRDLEDTIRNLTGQNETLAHRLQELDEKIDRQKKDFEYRLCAMTAQQLGAGTGQNDANAVPCPGEGGGGGATFNPPPQGNGGPQQLAPPPGVLGTLPSEGPPQLAAPPSTQPEFSSAMNLLAKARYDEARAAFRSFADNHPKDDLTPQAIFWIGDIAYVQRDYPNATRAFAEVIKKYPTSSRAPDSMLKLGQALIASGQKKEGCTALAALPAKYPKASKAVLDQGVDARRANCRKASS